MKTDIKEFDDKYEVEIDLPGFKKDEVQVELKDGYLVVSAEKGLDEDEKDKKSWQVLKKRALCRLLPEKLLCWQGYNRR